MGRSPSFADCLKPGQDLRKAVDADKDIKRIVEVAQGLEGIVRNNSIHAAAVVIADRPLHEIVPLQLAEDRRRRRGQRRGRQAGAPVQDRDPVLDGPDRGDRPAQDGLPRPAQPRRHRGRGRHHQAVPWRGDRNGVDPARRCDDLRDARQRRLRGGVPARVRGHAARPCARSARPSSTTSSRSVRSTGRARCASSPTTPAASATRVASRYQDPTAAPDHRGDLRLLHLPGAADGDLQADRRLQPGSRPTTCARRSARRSAT